MTFLKEQRGTITGKMTRKDLIDRVAEKFGLKKKEAEAIVKFVFQEIAETVKKGERVSIQGFGAFELRELKGRKIRNPRTGEVVKVPKREKVVFVDKITHSRFQRWKG